MTEENEEALDSIDTIFDYAINYRRRGHTLKQILDEVSTLPSYQRLSDSVKLELGQMIQLACTLHKPQPPSPAAE